MMVNQAKKKSRIKQKTPKPPRYQGWLSNDEQEIAPRQYRASQELMKIEKIPASQEFFDHYIVYSAHGESSYQVEIRSLSTHINSCCCPDYQVNRLGTCKHIEATLLKLKNRRKRRFQQVAEIGSQPIEIFLDRRDEAIKICWPGHSKRRTKAHDILEPYFSVDGIIIEGSRKNRLAQYQQSSFFYLANYEQVRPDGQEMNKILAPDIITIDEAQRINNWQTKIANAVKKLSSRYAFVLTGTPIENRIDEIYSIVQFLDPHIFGPLFRFNRDFYQ